LCNRDQPISAHKAKIGSVGKFRRQMSERSNVQFENGNNPSPQDFLETTRRIQLLETRAA
jgi:hypothetical protein